MYALKRHFTVEPNLEFHGKCFYSSNINLSRILLFQKYFFAQKVLVNSKIYGKRYLYFMLSAVFNFIRFTKKVTC